MNIQKNISQNKKYLFEYSFWWNKYLYFITNIRFNIYMNIYLNIHCKYLHEYSHDIRPGYQGNTPGMNKEVWRKLETRLEWRGWWLKVWEPLHVLRRDSEHVGWTWLAGSARATRAVAALHFWRRCRGGAPLARPRRRALHIQ